jgi:hypothetical protein
MSLDVNLPLFSSRFAGNCGRKAGCKTTEFISSRQICRVIFVLWWFRNEFDLMRRKICPPTQKFLKLVCFVELLGYD